MPKVLKFDDPMLVLITDALRAGPGTPEWHDAVTHLRTSGRQDADEYQMLYTAREHLASGREYREVRAGPGFTRKVLESIDRQAMSTHRNIPAATVIGMASLLLVVCAIFAIAKFLMPPDSPKPAVAEELSQLYFVNPQASTSFDETSIGEWKQFGQLALEHEGKMRVGEIQPAQNFIGGGVYLELPLAASEAFEVEATIIPKVSQNIVAQVFVTDDPNFGGDSATSPHELVCTIRNGEASVFLPSGRGEGQSVKIPAATSPLEIRVKLNRDGAIIEVGAARLFAGLHELDASKARYAGVRLLARAPEDDSIRFSSVRILTPQKK